MPFVRKRYVDLIWKHKQQPAHKTKMMVVVILSEWQSAATQLLQFISGVLFMNASTCL